MLKAISINNMRCIKSTKVQPLERINLISGKNGVGKTTFLESVWLHHGRRNPALIWQSIVLRGLMVTDFNPFMTLAQSVEPIEIIGEESNGSMTRLTVKISRKQGMNLLSNRTEESENFGETIKETLTNIDMKIADTSTQNIGVLDEVAWTYKNGKQKPVEIKAKLGKNQLGLPDVMFDGKIPVYSIPSGVFITASLRSPGGQDIITRFSNIVRAGQKQELMQYLTMVEPTLSDLELLTTGAKIGIWAFKNNGTKLPVELLGDGFGRVLSILLSLYEARNGILAIDEFEIGIHHSVMEKFWDSINVLSKDLNVQVFVTSHSKECIEAAYKALSQNSSDAFVLHRFYRKDDQIRTEPYYGDKILAAIEDSYEVR